MKRAALACAGMIALTGLGVASAEVTIYGRAHLALSYLDNGDDYSALNLSSNSSRLGFRAGHEFSPELRGLIQLEGQVDFDSNSQRSLSSRDSYLGLTGDWGLLRAGYISTPLKDMRSRVELFADRMGDARNVIRNNYTLGNDELQGFDERFRNSLAYRTPEWNGLRADLHYSVETQSGSDAEDSNANDAWSASVSYSGGPLFAAIGHERWSFEDSSTERDITRVTAYYDFEDFRVTGLAQTASDPGDRAYGAGLRYALNSQVHLKGQYYRLDADDSDYDADLVVVGADYLYARQLTCYLNVAQVSNGDLQNRTPWQQSSTLSRDAAIGETARGVALGAIYNF